MSKFDTGMPYSVQPPSELSLFTEAQHLATAPTSSQRMNGDQIHRTSTNLTIMCGVQCFRHFTNFTQSPRPCIPELKSALQQIWDDLPQTPIN